MKLIQQLPIFGRIIRNLGRVPNVSENSQGEVTKEEVFQAEID